MTAWVGHKSIDIANDGGELVSLHRGSLRRAVPRECRGAYDANCSTTSVNQLLNRVITKTPAVVESGEVVHASLNRDRRVSNVGANSRADLRRRGIRPEVQHQRMSTYSCIPSQHVDLSSVVAAQRPVA